MKKGLSITEKELFSKTASIFENLKHKKIEIQYGRGGNYIYPENGKFVINVATPAEKNIEKYTALNHELGHYVFDSFGKDVKPILFKECRSFPAVLEAIARDMYLATFNIIEDQRIESLMGQIYLGTNKRFKKTREKLGKVCTPANDPVNALLFTRFMRDDLVLPDFELAKQIIKDVELQSPEGGVVLTIEYIRKVINPYLQKNVNDIPKLPNGDLVTDVGEVNGDLSEAAHSSKKMNSKCDHQGLSKEMTPEEQQNIEKGMPILEELKAKGELLVEGVKEELQKNLLGGKKLLPASQVDIDIINRTRGNPYIPDTMVARQLNKIFRQLQEKSKHGFTDSGDEISIQQVIKRKADGHGDAFMDLRRKSKLHIMLAIDGSGSMQMNRIGTARDLVATLYDSLKNIRHVNLQAVVWSSNSKGNLGLTPIESKRDVDKIDCSDSYELTPTHIAVDYSRKVLQSMGGGNKVMIILTDGEPNYSKNHRQIASATIAEETERSVRKARSNGIKVIGILIGHGNVYDMEIMFGKKNFIHCRSMNDASDKLVRQFSRIVVKQIRRKGKV